jgi:hypothetical protein
MAEQSDQAASQRDSSQQVAPDRATEYLRSTLARDYPDEPLVRFFSREADGGRAWGLLLTDSK